MISCQSCPSAVEYFALISHQRSFQNKIDLASNTKVSSVKSVMGLYSTKNTSIWISYSTENCPWSWNFLWAKIYPGNPMMFNASRFLNKLICWPTCNYHQRKFCFLQLSILYQSCTVVKWNFLSDIYHVCHVQRNKILYFRTCVLFSNTGPALLLGYT